MTKVTIGVMNIEEAKRLQDQLTKKNIELFLEHNEATCTRGCAVTVELSCFEKDIPKISEHFGENYSKMLEGHDVNWEVMGEVFDPNKESATCPACATQFETNLGECPECGLCF